MAYTTLLNAVFAIDEAITSPTGLALRDNPLEIAAGGVGAPRIVDAALGSTATTAGRDWIAARLVLSGSPSLGIPMFMSHQSVIAATYNPDDTTAGSNLRFTSGGVVSAVSGSGTWKCLGYCITNSAGTTPLASPDRKTTWMRIS